MSSTLNPSLDSGIETERTPALTPKRAAERIAVLDIQRGIAILLIFFVNILLMGNTVYAAANDPRLLGWTARDRGCWWFFTLLIDGTQRGMLEFLFGAGALILLSKTLPAEGPVSVADMFFRRNLWLALFGVFDIFCLFWWGDILLKYAVAALFLFPFRRLSAKTLLVLALLYVAGNALDHSIDYQSRSHAIAGAARAHQKEAHGEALGPEDRAALATRSEQLASYTTPPADLAQERAGRTGSFVHYVLFNGFVFVGPILHQYLPPAMVEIFFSMLLGMALFKWGITQGSRSVQFYAVMAVLAYAPGMTLRVMAASTDVSFQALPSVGSVFSGFARIAITLGHVALINLLCKSGAGSLLLAPFKAAGRTAFSLYLMQSVLGMWILFAPFGFGLWARFGEFGLTMIALAVIVAQLILANLWLRWFAVGPLEWLWRSLAYRRVQPFRHRQAVPDPVVV